MTNTIFHVTVAALIGAMTVAGVAIAMAPSKADPPKMAATIPEAAPVAAAIPAAPPDAPGVSTAIKDACVVKALGRLPKIDGMRVTHSSYKFFNNERQWIQGNVSVSIEVRGHQAHYGWLCAVSPTDGVVILVPSSN